MKCIAQWRNKGMLAGMRYLRREYSRGLHQWRVHIVVVQKIADELCTDEHDIYISPAASLEVARAAAIRSIKEILDHDRPVEDARMDFYVHKGALPAAAKVAA